MPLDVDRLSDGLIAATLAVIGKELAPVLGALAELRRENAALAARLAAAEARAPVPAVGIADALKDSDGILVLTLTDGTTARTGIRDGRDAEPVEPLIAEAVRAAVADLPAAEPGRPGKDVDMAAVERMVADAVSALPSAKPGKDADPALIAQMVADAVAALPPAEKGKDADPEVIRSMVAEAVSTLPPPEKGKDADPQVIEAMVAERVAAAVAALPLAKPGKDADPAAVKAMVDESVAEAIGRLPVPKDGVGAADALIDRHGHLILTFTDGSTRNLGLVVGEGGKPGVDGFNLEDFSAEYDGERTLLLRFSRGDLVKEVSLSLPVVLDRGVWKEGAAYAAGDGVTWAGSFWVAQRATGGKPETTDDWRLAVKRGRDGKSLEPLKATEK